MIFGFHKDAAHAVLSNIASDLKAGLRYATDQRFNGVLGNSYTVMFKQLKAEAFEEYLGTAVDFYQKPFRAWVMFWPDKKDVFPFENGCELAAQNEAISIIR